MKAIPVQLKKFPVRQRWMIAGIAFATWTLVVIGFPYFIFGYRGWGLVLASAVSAIMIPIGAMFWDD